MDTVESASFGLLLRRYRLAAGLSQEELAQRAGLSARGISDLERELRRAPRRTTVLQLGEALGLDPEDRARLSEVSSRYGLRPSEPGAVPGGAPDQHETTRRTKVASAGHAG